MVLKVLRFSSDFDFDRIESDMDFGDSDVMEL